MPFTLTMPKLSPTMTSGVITKWRKKEGQRVEAEEVLIEVATDKATVEYAPLDGGWLRKILVQEGQEAAVNEPIALLTESLEESIEGYELPKIQEETKPMPTTQKKKEEVKSLPTPAIFSLEPPLEEPMVAPSVDARGRVKASPLAKKLAREQRLDLTTVQGSGPRGMVTSEDLSLAQKDAAAVFGSKKQPQIASGTYTEEELSLMRKKIAERLQQAKSFVPHFYVTVKIDASPLATLREQLKEMGLKVTINDLVIKAASLALLKHPEVNSGFNAANQTIVRFQTIDISIAVNIEEGLITPIIRHADYKNVGQISSEVKMLAEKARAGKLQPHEFKGGSFTISNLGMFGVESFSAILNPPQAAILAVGSVLEEPVVKEKSVVPGKVMSMTLSADHRVIDGALAATFLKTLQHFLEHPASLLVH